VDFGVNFDFFQNAGAKLQFVVKGFGYGAESRNLIV